LVLLLAHEVEDRLYGLLEQCLVILELREVLNELGQKLNTLFFDLHGLAIVDQFQDLGDDFVLVFHDYVLPATVQTFASWLDLDQLA
jgi:hypothetical protein